MRDPYGHSEPRTQARASVRRRGQQGDLRRGTTGLELVVTVLAGLRVAVRRHPPPARRRPP